MTRGNLDKARTIIQSIADVKAWATINDYLCASTLGDRLAQVGISSTTSAFLSESTDAIVANGSFSNITGGAKTAAYAILQREPESNSDTNNIMTEREDALEAEAIAKSPRVYNIAKRGKDMIHGVESCKLANILPSIDGEPGFAKRRLEAPPGRCTSP